MKGHMQDGKFHPHTDYKKVSRMKREPFRVTKDGVKITQRELIQMQRADVGRRKFDVNLRPTFFTKGLKTKLNSQVDFVNANINRGDLDEGIRMIDTMVSNLNHAKEKIQKHKESQERQEVSEKKHKETLENIGKERKARDPTIFDKVHELRQSEFKLEPNTQKNLTTQGSLRFLVDDIQSVIPKKNEIGFAVVLEESNVSKKLLEEQIKFLEKSAIDMYKFKQTKPVRIKQADRDELHRRIGDRLLMQVASLDSAPSPDFEKRGLTYRKLHQKNASENEFFGFDK